MVSPTWEKFSIGPYIRKERDKRAYIRLFKPFGVHGFKKIVFLLANKLHLVTTYTFGNCSIMCFG